MCTPPHVYSMSGSWEKAARELSSSHNFLFTHPKRILLYLGLVGSHPHALTLTNTHTLTLTHSLSLSLSHKHTHTHTHTHSHHYPHSPQLTEYSGYDFATNAFKVYTCTCMQSFFSYMGLDDIFIALRTHTHAHTHTHKHTHL